MAKPDAVKFCGKLKADDQSCLQADCPQVLQDYNVM